jgi:hypothetical protein
VRKCLTVVLARTQEAMIFSGYGLIDINLRTYLQVRNLIVDFKLQIMSYFVDLQNCIYFLHLSEFRKEVII